jgi:periplasmic protein CpxP/Spy
MNLNKTLLTLAATVALSAGAAFTAQADKPQTEGNTQNSTQNNTQRRGHKMFRAHAGRFAQALNLTDAQKEQAKAIREKHRTANEGLRTELRTLGEQIRAARQANNIAEAQRLAAQREPLLARAQEAWKAEREELKSVLTPEQQTKLEELRKSHTGKRQHRRG